MSTGGFANYDRSLDSSGTSQGSSGDALSSMTTDQKIKFAAAALKALGANSNQMQPALQQAMSRGTSYVAPQGFMNTAGNGTPVGH
jgi:hypothetical protein